MLKDRIQNHLSDIRTFKKYDKPVSIHFNSKDHSIDDFRYAGIEIHIFVHIFLVVLILAMGSSLILLQSFGGP
jgi:hypothetical protein